MILKLPLVISVELIIGILSFLLAGDKAQVGEIAFIFSFLTVVAVLTYFIIKRVKSSLL